MAKKLTKKMLNPLMRGELRKIAIVGLHLEPADAYTMKEEEITAWIYKRAEDLAKVDLDSIGRETFRDGIAGYLERLQSFIQGVGEAPVWPPNEEADAAASVVTQIPLPTEKAKVKKPVVAKKEVKKEPEKAEVEKATATVKRRGRPPKKKESPLIGGGEGATRFKKATAKIVESAKIDAEVVVADSPAEELFLIREVSFATSSLVEEVKDLRATVEALRQESTAANNLLANALLFVINSAILDESEEIVDLSKIPSPDKYITEE